MLYSLQMNPVEGTKEWRRLRKLKQAVFNETQRLVKDKRKATMEKTQEERIESKGYDPFSSSEEEDSDDEREAEEEEKQRQREGKPRGWRRKHRKHPEIFSASADMALIVSGGNSGDSIGNDNDLGFVGDDIDTLEGSAVLTPLALTLHIDSQTDSLKFPAGDEAATEDDNTVYSRESTKYPKISRSTLDLFGGKELEKEQRYMKRIEKKRQEAQKTPLWKLAEQEEEKKKKERKSRREPRVSPFHQQRRSSVIMNLSSTSKQVSSGSESESLSGGTQNGAL